MSNVVKEGGEFALKEGVETIGEKTGKELIQEAALNARAKGIQTSMTENGFSYSQAVKYMNAKHGIITEPRGANKWIVNPIKNYLKKHAGKVSVFGGIGAWYAADNLSSGAVIASRDAAMSAKFGGDPLEAEQTILKALERIKTAKQAMLVSTIVAPYYLPITAFFIKGIYSDEKLINERLLEVQSMKGGN